LRSHHLADTGDKRRRRDSIPQIGEISLGRQLGERRLDAGEPILAHAYLRSGWGIEAVRASRRFMAPGAFVGRPQSEAMAKTPSYDALA
jgi:hypothetical protein